MCDALLETCPVERRARVLKHVLDNGAAWEQSSGQTYDLLLATEVKIQGREVGH